MPDPEGMPSSSYSKSEVHRGTTISVFAKRPPFPSNLRGSRANSEFVPAGVAFSGYAGRSYNSVALKETATRPVPLTFFLAVADPETEGTLTDTLVNPRSLSNVI